MSVPNITNAIDEYIESVTDDRKPDGRYHPSSMHLCDRQVIYEVRGTPVTNPVDKKSKRRFYVGHRLHEIVQRAIESMKGVTDVHLEFEVDAPDENIKGHGDALIETDEDEWWIVEAKSTKKIAAKFGLPKPHHIRQAKDYAWAVKHTGVYVEVTPGTVTFLPPQGDRVKGIILIYLDKEELETWEYSFEYEDSWDDEMVEKLDALDAYRNDPASLPPRLPLNKSGTKQWPCNYCPFKDQCWKVDGPGVLPKMF